MIEQGTLLNFVGGTWERASVSDSAPIYNPATAQVIAKVPLSDKATVDKAVAAAQAALPVVAPRAARATASSRCSS